MTKTILASQPKNKLRGSRYSDSLEQYNHQLKIKSVMVDRLNINLKKKLIGEAFLLGID